MIVSFRLFLLFFSYLAIGQGQRISKRKCSEYREQTIQRAQFIYLQPNPEPIFLELFNCSKTVNLIIGGEEVKPGEFPHQAVLGWKSKVDPSKYDFRCGGSLISERYVLTAAHCFEPGPPDVVRLGEINLKNDNDNQEDYEVEEYIRHPQHRFFQSYNDIALIKLAENVPFHLFVRPACLWDSYDMNVTEVIATGFGLTEELEQSDKLLKVQLDFLPRKECENQYGQQRKFKRGVVDEQLCVGSIREGRDTCQGDSGGPIQVITEPEGCMFHILGLTSAGSSCGIGRSPSIYTRVAGYSDWIESIVWK